MPPSEPSRRVRRSDPPSPAGTPIGSPSPRAAAAERRRLLRELRQAIETRHLLLHYQPRVSLDGGHTVSAEALIRWPHPRGGFISPASFIPIAEEDGLIDTLGGWALATACAEAATWPERVKVSVNVSARQLREGSLIPQVARALECSGLKPERLELELTESMLLDLDEEVLMALGAVRDHGVGLALDDFGTGYASLGMLRQLPLTAMKLDRSLVRNLPHDPEDAAIAGAVVATGRALGLVVVGEGIEREEQRALLAGIGAHEGQGFLFGRAVPAAALLASLAAPGGDRAPLDG